VTGRTSKSGQLPTSWPLYNNLKRIKYTKINCGNSCSNSHLQQSQLLHVLHVRKIASFVSARMSTRNMIKRADIMRVTDLEGFTLSELTGQRADYMANKANEKTESQKTGGRSEALVKILIIPRGSWKSLTF